MATPATQWETPQMFERTCKQHRNVSFCWIEVIMNSKLDLFCDTIRWTMGRIDEPLTDNSVNPLPSLWLCHVCRWRRFFASAYWSVARHGVAEMLQTYSMQYDAMTSKGMHLKGLCCASDVFFILSRNSTGHWTMQNLHLCFGIDFPGFPVQWDAEAGSWVTSGVDDFYGFSARFRRHPRRGRSDPGRWIWREGFIMVHPCCTGLGSANTMKRLKRLSVYVVT